MMKGAGKMFEKVKLKRKKKKIIKSIEVLEKKRTRSQASLVESILSNTSPHDEDVDYFNLYSEKINDLRAQLSLINKELK